MILSSLSSKTEREHIPAEKLKIKGLVNCDFKDGKIQSRKGFVSNAQDIILKQYGFPDEGKSLKITENFLFLNGVYGRVAVDVLDNLMGTVTYNLLFLTATGKKQELGYIEFSSNGEDFGYPDSFTVFSGTKTVGTGIYFMARQCYAKGKPDFVSIRELGQDLKTWALLSDQHIYTPTVLTNGRGDSYPFATVGTKDLRLPEPILPESKNMLTPKFRALYTTDSTSHAFSLPYANIDSGAVRAEISLWNNKYSFLIPAGASSSDAVQVEGRQITMHIERAVGRVYFKSGDGANYSPEFTGEYNNLCITAAKTEKQSDQLIAASTACKKVEGSVPFGKNEVTLFYGNRLNPSLVAANSPQNPLYFSEKTVYSIGNAEKQVLYISAKGGRVFAFKEGKLFSGEIKTEEKNVSAGLNFYKTELLIKKQTEIPASPKAETVLELKERLIFQSVDNSVWEINLNSLSCKRIAENIFAADFAIILEDKYLLIKDDTALVVKENGGGYICAEWRLPARATGGLSYLEDTSVFFENRDDLVYIMYSASYSGEQDISLISEYAQKSAPVICSVLADLSDGENRNRRICKLSVEAEGKEVGLKLMSDKNKTAERRSLIKNGFADFNVGGIGRKIQGLISFGGATAVSGLVAEYRTLNKK